MGHRRDISWARHILKTRLDNTNNKNKENNKNNTNNKNNKNNTNAFEFDLKLSISHGSITLPENTIL